MILLGKVLPSLPLILLVGSSAAQYSARAFWMFVLPQCLRRNACRSTVERSLVHCGILAVHDGMLARPPWNARSSGGASRRVRRFSLVRLEAGGPGQYFLVGVAGATATDCFGASLVGGEAPHAWPPVKIDPAGGNDWTGWVRFGPAGCVLDRVAAFLGVCLDLWPRTLAAWWNI